MNLLLWVTTGALLAWAASFRAEELRYRRLLVDVAFGAIGGLLAGMAAVPLAQWLSFDTDWRGLAVALLGAAVMLLIANLRLHRDGR